MIKKIIILSRKHVERMLNGSYRINSIEEDWALISIYSDKLLIDFKEMETLKALGCEDHISLCFDDITKDEYEIKIKNNQKLKIFIKDHAESIINFLNLINKKPQIKTLVIHCAAGISRSGAIGLFVCRYLKLDENSFRSDNPQIRPNEYIYEVLSKVSGLKKDYISFWENQ